MIVIYAEGFDCDEAEKKKLGLGECHCPKVNLFYVHPIHKYSFLGVLQNSSSKQIKNTAVRFVGEYF